jgi:hypothetical protein
MRKSLKKPFALAMPLFVGLALLVNACETRETEIETPTGETEIEQPAEAPVSPAPGTLPNASPVPTTSPTAP